MHRNAPRLCTANLSSWHGSRLLDDMFDLISSSRQAWGPKCLTPIWALTVAAAEQHIQ